MIDSIVQHRAGSRALLSVTVIPALDYVLLFPPLHFTPASIQICEIVTFLLSFLYGLDDQTYCSICYNLIRFIQANLLIFSVDTVPAIKPICFASGGHRVASLACLGSPYWERPTNYLALCICRNQRRYHDPV